MGESYTRTIWRELTRLSDSLPPRFGNKFSIEYTQLFEWAGGDCVEVIRCLRVLEATHKIRTYADRSGFVGIELLEPCPFKAIEELYPEFTHKNGGRG